MSGSAEQYRCASCVEYDTTVELFPREFDRRALCAGSSVVRPHWWRSMGLFRFSVSVLVAVGPAAPERLVESYAAREFLAAAGGEFIFHAVRRSFGVENGEKIDEARAVTLARKLRRPPGGCDGSRERGAALA